MIASISLIEALASLSISLPIKTTVKCADLSSKHGTIVVGSGNLFSSKAPFKVCWRIYLSVIPGNELNPRMLWAYVARSYPAW